MPMFYAGQLDYLSWLNIVGGKNAKTTFTANATSTKTLDLSAGHVFVLNVSGTSQVTTLALANKPPSGTPWEITVYVNYISGTGNSIVWPTNTTWGGNSTTLTGTAGTTDVFKLFSQDSGATYYGQAIGKGYTT